MIFAERGDVSLTTRHPRLALLELQWQEARSPEPISIDEARALVAARDPPMGAELLLERAPLHTVLSPETRGLFGRVEDHLRLPPPPIADGRHPGRARSTEESALRACLLEPATPGEDARASGATGGAAGGLAPAPRAQTGPGASSPLERFSTVLGAWLATDDAGGGAPGAGTSTAPHDLHALISELARLEREIRASAVGSERG